MYVPTYVMLRSSCFPGWSMDLLAFAHRLFAPKNYFGPSVLLRSVLLPRDQAWRAEPLRTQSASITYNLTLVIIIFYVVAPLLFPIILQHPQSFFRRAYALPSYILFWYEVDLMALSSIIQGIPGSEDGLQYFLVTTLLADIMPQVSCPWTGSYVLLTGALCYHFCGSAQFPAWFPSGAGHLPRTLSSILETPRTLPEERIELVTWETPRARSGGLHPVRPVGERLRCMR